MKKSIVFGAGGFIGHHLVSRLKRRGDYVVGVDLKSPRYAPSSADEFFVHDLRDEKFVHSLLTESGAADLYQLAADMGGAGFVFTGENDLDIMTNSVQINVNVCNALSQTQNVKVFYSSSACMYPEYNQTDPLNPKCTEDSAYPAMPDSEYGWEKLFSERLYMTLARCTGVQVRIARYHNIFGPLGSWNDGREKAPAAICRKVATAVNQGGAVEVWGDGLQTRSFLYVDDCIDATLQLLDSDFMGPYNIGSEEMVSINELVEMVGSIAGIAPKLVHVNGPTGVRGRNSDNAKISKDLGWQPKITLREGLEQTYCWIKHKVENHGSSER